MGISAGLSVFKLSFEISPIILVGGVAANIPGGGMLPIVAITQALSFVGGLLSGGDDLTDLDDFFAHFVPLPGSTLGEQQIGKYPFANQAVAANAVIRQPLNISLRMICPARDESGYAVKTATMQALKSTLDLHNGSGGTYVVATPSYFYTNCVFLRLFDVSSADDKQVQNTYQWDFEVPLLTLQDAQNAQGNLMNQISNGTAITGSPAWSGLGPTVGNPASGNAPNVVGSAAGPAGAGVGPPSPPLL
jgi:hypothetical protein